MLERDGLPLLDHGSEQILGSLIHFDPVRSAEAYTAINAIEPDKLYLWQVTTVFRDGQETDANILFGRSPHKGSIHPEYETWDGSKEPLFTSAMTVIQETLEQNQQFGWNLEPFFRLQMAYLLLWCAIERFVSFKYHLGGQVIEKIRRLADDSAFVEALRELGGENREVVRSDDPRNKEVLRRDNPRKALDYYYQIRSNITHRGKSAVRDYGMLLASLTELHAIFQRVLQAEFSTGWK
ncbi:MAG: hypothetical protein ACHRXM_16710 [Isosphaerales bacterium]